ncbi:MAG TPA: OmpA family protein [Prolixibacteraceae bacterium]|nr:OmpA family protein [Prolixibacteraceae bacterium]HPT30780.1 OmpA family protein [Prolixibacteraceae bacterium]
MKKITLLLFVALFALNSFGQTMEKRVAIGLGPGYYFNLNDDAKGGFSVPNFFVSYALSPTFDLRGKIDLGLKQSNETNTPNYFQGGLDLRLKLYKDKAYTKPVLQPYLYAGPGYFQDNKGDLGTESYAGGLNFNGGIGTKLRIGPAVALYLEAGYIHGVKGVRAVDGVRQEVQDNFFKLSSIIEFDITDNDKDNDGVKNKVDDCPDTPGLAKFRGCPDTDGDGVPDPKDECPGTPEKCWSTVDAKGCPKDSDGDGIIDCEDDCPNAAGPKEFKGCPDTDGDGVIDKNDECPNTPKGCKVDAKGCPLDRDKDGVIDCQDDCPDEFGVKELKGCPIRCKDFEINNVQFDFDKADLKPAGIATLDEFVAKLNEQSCKEFDVLVNGHTCSIGGKNYNMTLSEKRAQAVVKYLISKGVNVAFVTGKGYGETEPAVPNTNKTNRETNRRAVVDLIIK